VEEDRASRTASRVALRRAAHQVLDRPLVFEDPLALKILRPETAERLRADPSDIDRGKLSKYLRPFVAVRSRIAEDAMAEAIAGGCRQVVILGAGLDTYAFRQSRGDVRVFEVDHPSTQSWKRRRLVEGGIGVPPTVTFVPVDFESQKLRHSLIVAGLDPSRPAIFSWLGVTPYLEEAVIWQTLTDIAALTAAGGGVVFDYSVPPDTVSLIDRSAFRQLQRRVAWAGEPFRSHLNSELLAQGLRDIGFSNLTDLGEAEINSRYFRDRVDGLRVGSISRVMVALR
jgi:methyltransferase (TIGR00027 family)